MLHAKLHSDERGYFCETYTKRHFESFGIDVEFVQDNLSYSAQSGTVRGLHFQSPPAAQAKLVRVQKGAVFDVAVDLRRGSTTYGRHAAAVLSAENWSQLFIPAGFAHGFMTLESDTVVAYKVSSHYSPANDGGVFWDDPDLGIEWPLPSANAVLSEKDRSLPGFAEFESPFP